MTPTAYSYVRFSTRGQISGDSLSRQLDMARDYARRHDLALDEHSYRDLGISAFRGKNATEGALKAFLDAVDDGTIPKNTTLLVESLDRISRAEVDEALELLLSITKRGVTVVTLADEQVYNRKTIKADWSKLIVGLTYMARAHEESARKSARSKRGMQSAVERGVKHAKCPWWLEASEDRKSYRVIPEKAAIVREVFDIRVRGEMGSFQLAKHLNTKYGFKYGNSQVAKLLRNPAVIGTRISQAGYEPRLGYYPAIIDKATYYDVQRLMDAGMGTQTGRPSAEARNLLRGLARCAHCGGAMRYFPESKRVTQRYLKCTTALTHPTCSAGFVNYDALEKEVLGTLLLDQDEALVPLLEKKLGPIQTNNAEISALKEQQVRLVEALASGVMNTRVVVEKMNAIEMQVRDLESAVLEVPPDDRLFAERAWELVERHEDAKLSGDVAALVKVRREIMAAFARAVKEIRVYDEARKRNDVRCKFTVTFRAFDGELVREYVRPALQNRFGVFNGRAAAG